MSITAAKESLVNPYIENHYYYANTTILKEHTVGGHRYIFGKLNIYIHTDVYVILGHSTKATAKSVKVHKENRDKEHVEDYFNRLVIAMDTAELAKKSQKDEENALKKEAANSSERGHYKVGNIFYVSFGYNMTLVEFYKVVSVKGCTVELIKVCSDTVERNGGGNGKCVPSDRLNGESFKIRIRFSDGKWGGKAEGHYLYAYTGNPVYFNDMD